MRGEAERMRFAIGGNGFIGSHTVLEILQQGKLYVLLPEGRRICD